MIPRKPSPRGAPPERTGVSPNTGWWVRGGRNIPPMMGPIHLRLGKRTSYCRGQGTPPGGCSRPKMFLTLCVGLKRAPQRCPPHRGPSCSPDKAPLRGVNCPKRGSLPYPGRFLPKAHIVGLKNKGTPHFSGPKRN